MWFVTKPCFQRNPGSGWVDRYRQKRQPALLEGQTDFRCCLCFLCLRRGAILCEQTTKEAQAGSTSSQVGGWRSRLDLR